LKETTHSNLSIPRVLKNAIRSMAAARNQHIYELLATLILRETQQAQGGSEPPKPSQPGQPLGSHPSDNMAR